MASTKEEEYPPTLTTDEQEHLIQVVQDWSIANGLTVRPSDSLISPNTDPQRISAVNAPVTLFPSLFPRNCFTQGTQVQKTYNELYAAVSRDEDFLEQIVSEVAGGDDFIRKLWDIHLKVKDEEYVQPLSLGLFRSDYMVHQDTSVAPPTLQVKQVEFNTIASSFGGLSVKTSELHQFLSHTQYPFLNDQKPYPSSIIASSHAIKGLADGIISAFQAYGKPKLGHAKCVIFLVQDDERNIFDQRHLEYELGQAHRGYVVPVFRLTFSQILKHTTLAQSSERQLLYHLPQNPSIVHEVAVVYIRAGYGPGDYPDQAAWDARYHLERSAAIKCPTVLTQLAGTKKVQQVLATPRPTSEPSAMSRFIPDDTDSARQLWKTFTNIYPMDTSPAGMQARELALDPEQCQSYVLKPQREGGGNNTYRTAIPDFLRSLPEAHWASYILMELITPPPLQNIILRNGQLQQGGVICELGVYGTCLWDQDTGEVKHNEEAGYLLRTKGDQSEEGGVAAGFGCMDSCRLVFDKPEDRGDGVTGKEVQS